MGLKNNNCIFALPSVTYAMRAKELLALRSVSAKVVSLDSRMTKKGCANGIEISCRHMGQAKEILLNASIPISEISGG